LTPEQEELCRLFYLNDLSAQEVALRLGREVKWVYRNLHKARTKLRAVKGGSQ
jgi:DNA-directed RNA polymerase specialized sigma24 family protein